MFINEKTHQFSLDINSWDFGGDAWFLINMIKTHHADEGRYINMVYHKDDGRLVITLLNPSKKGWDTLVNEVTKWAALKHACYLLEKQKQLKEKQKEEEKEEEDKPKKKGFGWPFGKR